MDNREAAKKRFTVIATGETYRIKHLLKEQGFGWDRDAKHWILKGASEGEVSMFQGWTRAQEWEGVDLTITEEKKDI